MKVYVVEASGKGGLIHYAYHLCRALQRTGVDTTLITSTAYELRDLPHEFQVRELLNLWDPRGRKAEGKIWRKVRRGLRAIQYILQWVKLVFFLIRKRPDVVLFGEMRFAFEYYFLRILKAAGVPLADIVHDVQAYDTRQGSESIVLENKRHIAQFNRIYKAFSWLFVHDKSNYDLFLKLYDVPAQHVYEIAMATNELVLEVKPTKTPDELRKQFGVAAGQRVVLFFGTISKYKGLIDLILAFPAVQKATGARLIVAGFPGNDVNMDEIKATAQELGVADHIAWFLDYVPNEWVVPLMELSDVVVLPYRAITQSAVIQIAYACGKPVVATRTGGLPDIVEEGRSGLLANPEDPASLAEAITKVISNPADAQRYGQHARHLAETKYAWRVVAERIKSAFESPNSSK